MPFQTPILLLLFNRPHHTRALLKILQGIKPARLYVHVDGPRAGRPGEAEQVAESQRLVVEMVNWPCRVERLFRPENAGLRTGVSGAISWFFEQEERGIILEDDIRPHPDFFPYCETLLAQYGEDERIMHIGGLNLAQGLTADRQESYFASRFVFVWGWATWRRAWQQMRLTLEGLDKLEQGGGLRRFLPEDAAARAYLRHKFQETQAGRNQSWAYAWFFSVLAADGLCLIPKVNLVENAGIGEEAATHTTRADARLAVPAHALGFPLKHPEQLTLSTQLDQQLFYRSQKSRLRLWAWFFLKKLGLR